MNKINIQWSVQQIEAWFNENPSLSWGDIWEFLSECFEQTISKQDKIKIKQVLAMRDCY